MADRDLKACAVCTRVFAREDLGPLETGDFAVRRWDTRPRGGQTPGQPGRGVRESRVGLPWAGTVRACRQEIVVLACRACGGAVAPPAPPPLWRVARAAWAEAVRDNPALARFVPRPRR